MLLKIVTFSIKCRFYFDVLIYWFLCANGFTIEFFILFLLTRIFNWLLIQFAILQVADFWKEAHILGQLHHPNIVALYGVVTDGPFTSLATVTEYMVNGSLKQVLWRKDRYFFLSTLICNFSLCRPTYLHDSRNFLQIIFCVLS